MSRPTLEVADIIRRTGNGFGSSSRGILHGRIARCSMPSSTAAPRHWAVIAISASAAAIRPSRFHEGTLQFHGSFRSLADPRTFSSWLRNLFRNHWVVYAKPPFGGAEYVLNYLARYTHRVAISNHRLVAFENHRVSFRWRDYAHGGKKKVMTVSAHEFLRRFLLHVLPKGLVRIRLFGLCANRRRSAALQRRRALLDTATSVDPPEIAGPRCPACFGAMVILDRLPSSQLYFCSNLTWSAQRSRGDDSS